MKKYLLNGKVYDADTMNSFAQKSGMALDDYLKESGASEFNDNNTYTLNGKDYSGDMLAGFAQKSDIPYDDYLKESGAKKKESSVSPSSDGNLQSNQSNNQVLQFKPINNTPSANIESMRHDEVYNNPVAQQLKQFAQYAPKQQQQTQQIPTELASPQQITEGFNNMSNKFRATSDNTQFNPAQQSLEGQEAIQNQPKINAEKKQLHDEAVDNSIQKYFNNKGINAPKGSALYNQQKAEVENALNNGIVQVGIDPKTGERGLYKTTSVWQDLKNGWNESVKGSDDAANWNSWTPQQQVDYLDSNESSQDKNSPFLGNKSSYYGSVGKFIGSSAPTLGKTALGGLLGITLVAAAPETGGMSLEELPAASAFMFTAPDMINQSSMNEQIRRYYQIRKDNPNISKTDAMQQAHSGMWAGGAQGLLNAALMTEGQLPNLEKGISGESKGVLLNAFDRTVKPAIRFGVASGGITAATEAEGNLEGVNTDANQIFNDSMKSAGENASQAFLLGLAFHAPTLVPALLKNAAKYGLVKNADLDEIQKIEQLNESVGNTPQGTTQQVMDDLRGYKQALDKTPESLTPDTKAQVAGLIQKKGNIQAEAQTKDEATQHIYETQIDGINNQIKKEVESNEPYQHEVDNLTGNTYAEELKNSEQLQPEPLNAGKGEASSVSSERVEPNQSFRTMEMGNDEGKDETPEARKQMKVRMSNGDIPMDGENGKGETGKQFANRILSAWNNVKDNEPENTTVVTHSSVLKAIKAYEDMKDKPSDPSNFTPEEWKEFSDNYNKESTENGDLETFKGKNGNIHVIRHGQTEDNENNKFRSGNTPLTEKGIKQAEQSGKELNNLTNGEVPKIISSDLPRAIHSSDIINSQLKTKENAIKEGQQPESNQPEHTGVPQGENIPENVSQVREEGRRQTSGSSSNEASGKEQEKINQKSNGNTIGISHERLSKQNIEAGGNEPERATYITPEEHADNGRRLLNAGQDPNDLSNLKRLDDKIDVSRAHLEDLAKIKNAMGDKWGMDSDQYKKANQEFLDYSNNVVKQLGSEAGSSMTGLQGERDIDTGSFTSLSSALQDEVNRKLTPTETKKLKEISSAYNQLKKDFDELRKKVNSESENNEVKGKNEIRFKKYADDFRKTFKQKEFTFKDDNGNEVKIQKSGLGWNDLVEIGAKAIEKTGQIIDGINEIIDKIKDEDWYKKLTQSEKDRFSDELTDYYKNNSDTLKRIENKKKKLSELQMGKVVGKSKPYELSEEEKNLDRQINEEKTSNLGHLLYGKFLDKKDNVFSPKDAKDVWNYVNGQYLDKNIDFDVAMKGAAADLGLSVDQLQHALGSSTGMKKITDEMYRNQYRRDLIKRNAKLYILAKGDGKGFKILKAIMSVPRGLKVFGHGTIPMETHVGMSKFDLDPAASKLYFQHVLKTYKLYGSSVYYEKAMQALKSEPTWALFNRLGLHNHPDVTYEDYLLPNTWFKKSWAGKLQEASRRGFDILKIYRQAKMQYYYDKLSQEEKSDEDLLKQYTNITNHETGSAKPIFREGSNAGKLADQMLFAQKLETARWASLHDIAHALKVAAGGKNSTMGEKRLAKMVLMRAARLAGAYMGGLLINNIILSVTGSKQKINWTDPTKSDFLDYKIAGKNIGLTGGMVSLVRFLYSIPRAMFSSKKELHNKSTKDAWVDYTSKYVQGKLSPLAQDAIDVGTHHDYNGNTLPFYNDKPIHSYNKKLTWPEYSTKYLPIPFEGMFDNVKSEMENNGLSKPDAITLTKGIFSGAVEGTLGVQVKEDFSTNEKKSSFTNEDLIKNPNLKFFVDKKANIPHPNINLVSSDPDKKGVVHNLKDMSNQDKEQYTSDYNKGLNDYFNKEIGGHGDVGNKKVYLRISHDLSGNEVNSIKSDFKEGEDTRGYKYVNISTLNTDQINKLMKLAADYATDYAKNILNQKFNK